MDKEIKRAKIFNYTVTVILLLIFIIIVSILGVFYMDCEWLAITMENGVAVSYTIGDT